MDFTPLFIGSILGTIISFVILYFVVRAAITSGMQRHVLWTEQHEVERARAAAAASAPPAPKLNVDERHCPNDGTELTLGASGLRCLKCGYVKPLAR